MLDEILQGTNSAERQIAVRQVISFLVAQHAIGAISTHDLALADLPEFAARAQLVHFQETLTDGPKGPIMRFDYRLEQGLATSTNALRLVAMLGLDGSVRSSPRKTTGPRRQRWSGVYRRSVGQIRQSAWKRQNQFTDGRFNFDGGSNPRCYGAVQRGAGAP